jgi:hypothetical protein
MNFRLFVFVAAAALHAASGRESDSWDDSGFCPARSECEASVDRTDADIPASWVGYLHSYEEAKMVVS